MEKEKKRKTIKILLNNSKIKLFVKLFLFNQLITYI